MSDRSSTALTELERAAGYARLGRRRRAPGVAPIVDRDLVDRDAIASLRLAGIAATPEWFKR